MDVQAICDALATQVHVACETIDRRCNVLGCPVDRVPENRSSASEPRESP